MNKILLLGDVMKNARSAVAVGVNTVVGRSHVRGGDLRRRRFYFELAWRAFRRNGGCTSESAV